MTTTETLLGTLSKAEALFKSEDSDYDLRKLIESGELYKIHDYDKQGPRPVGTIDCGSVRLVDTPACLYRVLFLFKPEALSFRDMYKNAFLTIVSPGYSLVATVEFFKYELALYFAASKEHVTGPGSSIISGSPGSYNGVKYSGELPERWFGLLRQMIERKWMVYGGNDFEV